MKRKQREQIHTINHINENMRKIRYCLNGIEMMLESLEPTGLDDCFIEEE